MQKSLEKIKITWKINIATAMENTEQQVMLEVDY